MQSPPDLLETAWRFEAIGTTWSIETPAPLGQQLKDEISCAIDDFDCIWSRFRADSLVSRMARAPGSYDFGVSAAPLLDLYVDLYRRTHGAVTPLVGNALEHLGYDANCSLATRPGRVQVPVWQDVITRNGTTLTNSEPVTFDVGAAGKGYLVDLVLKVLQDSGIEQAVVDASGDLRHLGTDVQRVGLEHPSAPGTVIGVANISGNALCASAVNRRAWGNGLHHVLDARTGLPTTEIIATWAIAPTALVADGLATALFFGSPQDLRGIDFSFLRMLSGGRVEYSRNFDGEIFR